MPDQDRDEPQVTERSDGFFEVEGVQGYFREEDARRVARQVAIANRANPNAARALPVR